MNDNLLMTVLGWVLEAAGFLSWVLILSVRHSLTKTEQDVAVIKERIHVGEMLLAKEYATESQLEKMIDTKLVPVNDKLAKIILFLERQNKDLPLS
jgi:hypothetical protein